MDLLDRTLNLLLRAAVDGIYTALFYLFCSAFVITAILWIGNNPRQTITFLEGWSTLLRYSARVVFQYANDVSQASFAAVNSTHLSNIVYWGLAIVAQACRSLDRQPWWQLSTSQGRALLRSLAGVHLSIAEGMSQVLKSGINAERNSSDATTPGVEQRTSTRCQGVTRVGRRCERTATMGEHCSTHARKVR